MLILAYWDRDACQDVHASMSNAKARLAKSKKLAERVFAETIISSFVGTYLKSKLKEEYSTATLFVPWNMFERCFDVRHRRSTGNSYPFLCHQQVGLLRLAISASFGTQRGSLFPPEIVHRLHHVTPPEIVSVNSFSTSIPSPLDCYELSPSISIPYILLQTDSQGAESTVDEACKCETLTPSGATMKQRVLSTALLFATSEDWLNINSNCQVRLG